MCFTRGGKFWVKGGRERLSFVDPSQSRTTIQVNLELDLKSTADLTSSQVATSLQVKFELHFNRHSDFTPSETRRSLLGCFGNEWRGTCLEVILGEKHSRKQDLKWCRPLFEESWGDVATPSRSLQGLMRGAYAMTPRGVTNRDLGV